jgi:hypothetical protein
MKKTNLLLWLLSLAAFGCTDGTTETGAEFQDLSSDTLFASIKESKFTGVYNSTGYQFLVNSISPETYAMSGPAVSDDQALRDKICIDDEVNCMEEMEKHYLSLFADRVQRKGANLILTLDNGQTAVLKNNQSTDDTYEVYQFVTLDERKNYIAAVYYYESFGYVLVNGTNGHITRTIGYPVLSPDRQQYIAANYDMVAAYTYNGLDMLSIGKDSVYSDALIDFGMWGPEEIKWKDDSTLYVKQKSQLEDDPKESENYAAIRIRKRGQL